VKERPRIPIGTVVAATIGLAVALGLRPASVREILAAYVLALAAIALLVLARMARTQEEWERATSELERALAPRRPVRARPSELVRVERDLLLSSANAAEFDVRLRPMLLEIAAARVERPEEALDGESWKLLRPDRQLPEDRGAPGPSLAQVAGLVEAIERL